MRTKQLKQQKSQKINLNIILGTVNAISESKKRKREGNIIKDIKNLFKLKEEIDNSAP